MLFRLYFPMPARRSSSKAIQQVKIATYLALSVHATFCRDQQGIAVNLLPASNSVFIAPHDVLRTIAGKENNDKILAEFRAALVRDGIHLIRLPP